MADEQPAPIACTLSGTDYEERIAWIAQLNRDGLRTHRREGVSLRLDYDAAVRDRVHDLVRRESICCAFLTFTVDGAADGVTVTITVPDRARDNADALLEPFLPADGGRSPSSAAVTTMVGIVACAACCLLPFATPAAAMAGAGAALGLGIAWPRVGPFVAGAWRRVLPATRR
jgi:hypothetical protein